MKGKKERKNSKGKQINIKNIIKDNLKLIIVFVLGVSLSSTIAYGATILFDSEQVSYDNTTSGLSASNVQSALDELYVESTSYQLFEQRVSAIENKLYPVGSIYISMTDDTVAKVQNRMGGTWEAFGTGRTLVGVDTNDTSFDTIGKTGGSKTHSIEVGNLPVHNHSIPSLSGSTNTTGSHNHTLYSRNYSAGGSTGAVTHWGASGTTAVNVPAAGDHSHTVTTNASNTNGCTNCSGTALSTQDKYITVYMYKRTA